MINTEDFFLQFLYFSVVELQGNFTFIQSAKIKDFVTDLHLTSALRADSATTRCVHHVFSARCIFCHISHLSLFLICAFSLSIILFNLFNYLQFFDFIRSEKIQLTISNAFDRVLNPHLMHGVDCLPEAIVIDFTHVRLIDLTGTYRSQVSLTLFFYFLFSRYKSFSDFSYPSIF